MLANVAMGMLSANAWKVVCYVAIRVMSDAPEHIEVCISVKLILRWSRAHRYFPEIFPEKEESVMLKQNRAILFLVPCLAARSPSARRQPRRRFSARWTVISHAAAAAKRH
jgi:hypothetical protein